jgi:hypothetical protein
MNITVHIERLVLDETIVASGERGQLQAAVRAELLRLLTAGGLSPELARGGALPSVPVKAIQLGNTGAFSLGRQIAGSLYSGIGASSREKKNEGGPRKPANSDQRSALNESFGSSRIES